MSLRSKRSLHLISSHLLNQQREDIDDYTSGHLNERHLYRPPEQATHKKWDTVKQSW